MVIVGHSMGGLLTKMMVQDSGTRLWQVISDRPVDELAGDPADRDLLPRSDLQATTRRPSRGLHRHAPPRQPARSGRTGAPRLAARSPRRPAPRVVRPAHRPQSTGLLQAVFSRRSAHEHRRTGMAIAVPHGPGCGQTYSEDRGSFHHRGPARSSQGWRDRRSGPLRKCAPRRDDVRISRVLGPPMPGQSRRDPRGSTDSPGARRAVIVARAKTSAVLGCSPGLAFLESRSMLIDYSIRRGRRGPRPGFVCDNGFRLSGKPMDNARRVELVPR